MALRKTTGSCLRITVSFPCPSLFLAVAVMLASCASNPLPPPAAAGSQTVESTFSGQRLPLPDIAGPEAGFAAAIDAYGKGDRETASLYARSVMERYPHTPWQKRSLYLLGRTLIDRNRTADAEAVMLRVPVEYPDLADYALFSLAEHFASRKRPADAVVLYRRLIENYPASTLAPRASLRQAQVLFENGSFRDAASAFVRTLADYPRSDQAPAAGLGLGRSLVAAGDLAGAARAYLAVRVEYPSASTDAETDQALAALKARGADVPALSGAELYDRAMNLFRSMQYDKAVESFRAALDADPSHPRKADILLRSGIALYNLGRRPEAASVLERLLSAKLPDCRSAEALNWLGKSYSRLGLREEAIDSYLKLVRLYPDSDWADDALYLTGNVYRDAGDTKKALKYYRRLADEYPDSSFADSALWWEGWSWYSAGRYAKARTALHELVSRYPRSFLANQALYWEGRSAERMGDRTSAERLYRRAVSRGPFTYYGYRAAERLGADDLPAMTAAYRAAFSADPGDPAGDEGETDDPESRPAWTDDAVAALSANPAYRKALELMYLDMKQEAATELRVLQGQIPGRYASLIGVSKAFFELGDYHSSLNIILRNFDRSLERPVDGLPDDLWLLAYPQGFWSSIVSASRAYGMDPCFVAAIIREESQFRPEALSPAGARGVMQVMPATAEWIARSAGLSGFDREQLFEADVNISVGTWYLSYLMKRFQGDLYRVSAAYNAGPEAVASWSGPGDAADPAAFVETIPYLETRGYVKKVLRNYAEYRRLYGKGGASAQSTLSSASDAKQGALSGAGMLVCQATGSCPRPAGGR
jgi:soluble lytic murein transglycosylase